MHSRIQIVIWEAISLYFDTLYHAILQSMTGFMYTEINESKNAAFITFIERRELFLVSILIFPESHWSKHKSENSMYSYTFNILLESVFAFQIVKFVVDLKANADISDDPPTFYSTLRFPQIYIITKEFCLCLSIQKWQLKDPLTNGNTF